MKRANGIKLITLVVIFLLFLVTAIYVVIPADTRLIINAFADFTVSLVEVPLCYSRIANTLGIESGNVRAYVIESLVPGMTISEVEATLSQIVPITIQESYKIESNHTTYISVGVDLCTNPFGDMFLDIYFSKDQGLIRVDDAWGD